MAVPQRRTSKTRKRLRRTHFKLAMTGLATCPETGELIRAHHVNPYTGMYNGKKVLDKDGKVIKAETAVTKPAKAANAPKKVAKKEVVEEVKAEAPVAKKAAAKKAPVKKAVEGEAKPAATRKPRAKKAEPKAE